MEIEPEGGEVLADQPSSCFMSPFDQKYPRPGTGQVCSGGKAIRPSPHDDYVVFLVFHDTYTSFLGMGTLIN
jgi:hypothetical protein